MPVLIEILKGNSFQYIAESCGISINRINDTYIRALQRLIRGRKITYIQLEDENKQLKERLEIESQRISDLEHELENIKETMQPIEVLKIPEQLKGDNSLRMMSTRLFRALKANGIENLYDLALITHKHLGGMRNLGSKSIAEVKMLMAQHWIFFDDVESLKNIKIASLPGPFEEIPVDKLLARKELLQKTLNT